MRIQPRYDHEVYVYDARWPGNMPESHRTPENLAKFHPFAGTKRRRMTWAEWFALTDEERKAEDDAALARNDQQWRKRRLRRFVAALVFVVVAYVAAVVTTWMVGNSVAVFVILPLYAILLAVFYGPFGWSIDGSIGYTRNSVESTPTGEDGRH
jgi:fatty acid desaturase